MNIERVVRRAIPFLLTTVLIAAEPAKVAGQWQFTVQLETGTEHPVVTFEQEGEKLTGTYEGRHGKSTLEGTIKENHIEFTVTVVAEGTTVSGAFTGTYDEDKMNGDVKCERARAGTWTAVRIPPKK